MTLESGVLSILKALLRVSPDLLRVHRMDVIFALETIAERVGVTVIRCSSSAPYQQVHTATHSFHTSPTPINNELLQQTTGTLDNAYEEGLIRSVSGGPGSVQQSTAPNSTSERENSVPEDETQPTMDVVLSEPCSSNPNSPPSPRAQRLLQKIKENLNDICQFSKHSPHDIVEGFFENLRSEDCRLGHIKSITGKNTPEPKERFIHNLQQAGSTRLDDVSRIPSSARNKNGNFRHYVERVVRFIDTETAYIALKRGTKQLAVENVCDTSGIEIAISFAYESFDALTYLDIHNFSSLLKGQENILDTLKKASCWVELSQSTYNGEDRLFQGDALYSHHHVGRRQNKRCYPESPQSRSSSYAARRRHLVSQRCTTKEIGPLSSGGSSARKPNDMQDSENSSAPNLHPPEMHYPDSTALYDTDGILPQYQTCQYSGLDSLANAATNLSHSEEAGNPERRDNGSGLYNTNIEQPIPSGNYPQSTSQGKSTANELYQNVQSGNTDTRSILPRSIVFQPANSAPVARPNITGSEQGCQRQPGERSNPLPPRFPPSPNPKSGGFGSNNARQEFAPQAAPHNLDFNCFDSAMEAFACRVVPHGSDFNDLGNVNHEMQLFASQDAVALMSGFENFGSANYEMQQFASQGANLYASDSTA
ncbi:hypothetical protein RJ035_008025 [Blastomyces gilchristii]